MRRSRWPSVDASAGQVLMLGVAKWSASLHVADATQNTTNSNSEIGYIKEGVLII